MKLTLAAVLLCAGSALAQAVNPYKDPTPGISGYRAEVLAEVRVQEDKFLRLAEAIPAEQYKWRPGADARSVSEVFLHVAAAGFNLPKLIGTPPPAGFEAEGYDTSTADKTKVIAALKDAFAHEKKAILAMPDADLDKQLNWFGGKNTERGVLLFMTRHTAEHLGQSIAYARMLGVIPPWTEDQQRQRAAPKSK